MAYTKIGPTRPIVTHQGRRYIASWQVDESSLSTFTAFEWFDDISSLMGVSPCVLEEGGRRESGTLLPDGTKLYLVTLVGMDDNYNHGVSAGSGSE